MGTRDYLAGAVPRASRAPFGREFTPAFAGSDLGADYWLIRGGGAGIGGLQGANGAAPAPAAGDAPGC